MTRRLWLLVAGLALVTGCGAPTLPAAQVQPVTAPAAAVIAEPAEVQIPSIHVVDDLVPVGMDALENGKRLPVADTGWYRLSPRPGQAGRAVLAGHVDYDGVPGAFKHLPQVKVGDLITTVAADGVTTTFAVYTARQIKKARYTAETVPLVFAPTTARELALVTCSGTVIDHSYDSNTVVLARAI